MSAADDIVALQLLADDVEKARNKAERLLHRLADLSRRVDGLNRDDPGPGSPTRMDGICRFSRISGLRRDLLAIADAICEALDEEPARFGHREAIFYLWLINAGIPAGTVDDALEGAIAETSR